MTAGDGMKRCMRCNRKRGFLARLFGLDKEYCDKCLLVINQEIRTKIAIPASNRDVHDKK